MVAIATAALLLTACNCNDEPEKTDFVRPEYESTVYYTYYLNFTTDMYCYWHTGNRVHTQKLQLIKAPVFGYSTSEGEIKEPFWRGGDNYCDSVAFVREGRMITFRRKDNDAIFSRSNYTKKGNEYGFGFYDEDFENGTPVETDRADE